MGGSASSESIYRWLEHVECARGAGQKEPSRALPRPSMSKPKHKQQRDQPSTTHPTSQPQHLPAREIYEDQQALEMPPERKKGAAAGSKQGLQQPEHQATQGGKRKRLATEDDSQAEGEPFTDRTTITKPSKTTRQQLWLLHDATPRVICQPFGSKKPKPSAVMDLMRVLVESRDSAMMDSMHRLVENRYPFELLSYVSEHADPASSETTELFDAISDGYDLAIEAHADFGDESAWSEVVSAILRNALKVSARKRQDTLLEVRQVQAVSIEPATLLPAVDDKVPFKKVDHLVSFSAKNANVGTLIDAIQSRRPGILLSPTEDPSVARTCQLLPVEVKSPDGTYYSSSVQLATWLSASFGQTRQLQGLVTAESIEVPALPLPVIGISVVGHNWNLHMAAQAENRNVTVYGPISMGDTMSFDGVFRIFSVLGRIEQWAREVYWPWLRDTILTPLAGPEIGGND